jgi:hypothetical protein
LSVDHVASDSGPIFLKAVATIRRVTWRCDGGTSDTPFLVGARSYIGDKSRSFGRVAPSG